MPLLLFQRHSSSLVWAIWNITESPEELLAEMHSGETIPPEITNPRKQAEWFAGRLLVRYMLVSLGIPYQGLQKDIHGKPWIVGRQSMQLSLSNSFPLVAASVHPRLPVGIDIERPRFSMLKVVPRVLKPLETARINENAERACMLWCAKEALFKRYGKKPVSLRNDLTVDELPDMLPGRISGLVFGERVHLYGQRVMDHILVFTETQD